MRIWIVNQYAKAPGQAGGTRHFSLARKLIARGHDVLIIAAAEDSKWVGSHDHKPSSSTAFTTEDGVPFLRIAVPPYKGNGPGRLRNMWTFAYRVAAKKSLLRTLPPPDVVIGSSPHHFAARSAARLARRFHSPFILEVRDLWPQTLIDVGSISRWHPVVLIFGALERYLYRTADRIVTLLPGSEAHITRKGGSREKIEWIPNGVDLELVPAPSPPSQKSFLQVTYAGSHGPANNLDVVLSAARLLQHDLHEDQIRFLFVGDGPEKQRLERRAVEENIDNVTFLPPVPKSDVFPLLGDADVLMVSLKEGAVFEQGISPNKIFDYMAVARPIVMAAGVKEAPFTHAEAGLLVDPTPEAVAKAIISLRDLPREELLAMGSRGRKYVEDHFDVASHTEVLESLVDSLVASERV